MLEGRYYNRLDDLIEVEIGVDGLNGYIDDDETGVYFAGEEAVMIETQVNDTFDVLLCSQVTISLKCRNYVAGFFASNATDVSVKVKRNGVCVFAGFVEPQAYSQDYADEEDLIELSCIDALTAFQYSKYRDVGSRNAYATVKRQAERRSFADVMQEIMDGVAEKLGENLTLHYDESKALPGRTAATVFEDLKISELLFLGDSEDDVWQNDEVVKQILQFLDLHMVQIGTDVYVFDWESLKNHHFGGRNVEICSEIAVGDDHKLTIGETYNQIRVKCDVKSIDEVIESPLESGLLVSPFANKQKYMTEYSAAGVGTTACDAFNDIIDGRWTDYDAARVTDWFVQVKNNVHWRFNIGGQDGMSEYCNNGTRQQDVVNALREQPGAALLSWGNVERSSTAGDNAPVSKVEMTDYLFVSVNGNGRDDNGCYPQAEDIKGNIPYASYVGHVSGGVFSPVDDDTANYIVLSGKIGLNPLMSVSGDYVDLKTTGASVGQTVPLRNGDGRYYTQQWWKAETPQTTAVSDNERRHGLVPWTDDGEQGYEFRYSAVGESFDRVSKVAVLACMLVIGDKCVVETGSDGQVSDFEWREYKKLEECVTEDEYYQQCFYIGFDPKIGDKLVGTMFSMQNNIDYTLGIDAEGIAIPIRKSDNVNGSVEFKILGPVNTVWSEGTRRHATFFRHTQWGENKIPLLAHVSSIVVEDFSVKIYSDNELVSNGEDKDLIYVSDTYEQFVNKKDDIEWKINSSLTGADCRKLGVKNGVKMSSPADANGGGVVTITDCIRNRTEKPEKLYVDAYYSEYHLPKVVLETTLEDRDGIVGAFNLYDHPALGKRFFVEGISRDMDNGAATLKLKEL